MQAFFQGKIDNFCALYAVLNGLQIVHDITPFKARDLFNATLMDISQDPAAFLAVLEHKTDYHDWVDFMLDMAAKDWPLQVEAPFARVPSSPTPHDDAHKHSGQNGPDDVELWECLTQALVPEERCTAIFRFCRYLPMQTKPCIDHWSTGFFVRENTIHLLDASKEEEAIHKLKREDLTLFPALCHSECFSIVPQSIRLLRKAS